MTTEVSYLVSETLEVTTATQDNSTPYWHHYLDNYKDLTQIPAVYYTFLIICIMVIVVGLIGNLMVIIVILKHKSMRTTTNYYIFSLAVSDFLITAFAMPCKMIMLMGDATRSPMNNIFCCIIEFMMPTFVFTSVWTLVAISLDRYLVIVHPLKSRYFNTRARAIRTLIIIWTSPIVVFSPYFIPFEVIRFYFYSEYGAIGRSVCQHTLAMRSMILDMAYRMFQLLIIFVIPLGILCFTCGSIAWRLLNCSEDDAMLRHAVKKEEKGRRKVAKMVLVVVLAFTLCWLPHYIVSIIAGFTSMFRLSNFIFIQVLIFTLGFTNSCMNPIIYALMSRAFRKGFWGILTTCCPRYRHMVGHQKRRPDNHTQHSISEATNNHSRRRQQRSQETTQYTVASSDPDDDISLKKIGHRQQLENNYVIEAKPRIVEDNKEKRERLLNNLLDESDMKMPDLNQNEEMNTATKPVDLSVTSLNGSATSVPKNGSANHSDDPHDSVFVSPPLSPVSPVTPPSSQFETQPLI